jgi:hypothetical protein
MQHGWKITDVNTKRFSKIRRKVRDESKEGEIGGKYNMRGRLETLTHNLLEDVKERDR